MKRPARLVAALFFALVAFGFGTAFAQPAGRGGQAQEPPKNLQVLPKAFTRPQVLQVMQA